MKVGRIYPIPLNETTAYLAGVIVGDGHVSNACKSKIDRSKDYRIGIEVVDYEFLKIIERSIKSIIKTKNEVKGRYDKRGNRKKLYYFQFRNKSFHYFLTNDLGIPAGNKCSSVKVPLKIFNSLELQKSFLAGLFDTDGGIRGKSIGFTSASNLLIENVSEILKNLKIKHHLEFWLNKKYNQTYYGIQINKRDDDRFLKYLQLNNKEKLKRVFRHVAVPEWSNGMVDSVTEVKN